MNICLKSLIPALLLLILVSCTDRGADTESADQVRSLFTETGQLQAVNNTGVVMPWYNRSYGQPQITYLAPEGTVVEPGDLVAELDKAGVQSALENAKTELEIAVADLNNMKMTHITTREQNNSELRQSLSRLMKAQIDTQRVAYESESQKKIKQLALRKSELSLQKTQRKIATAKTVQEHELNIKLAEIEQIRSSIETAERTLQTYSLKAPANGMVVYGFTGGRRDRKKVQVGDKIWRGRTIIQLPDLTRMKAETQINETDIFKIETGQKVEVRLDAYPQKAFDGVVTRISNTCYPKSRGSRIKVFDVELLVEGTDPILKPGMTVSCEFLSVVEPVTAKP